MAELEARGLGWSDALLVQLYLPDMAHFGAANNAYCQHLPAREPPGRACVQLALAPGVALLLEVALAGEAGARGRRVLHVQSISCWAPSCIGPYSQATPGTLQPPNWKLNLCSQPCLHSRVIQLSLSCVVVCVSQARGAALSVDCGVCMPDPLCALRQGVQWGGLVWMAGQIGLDPPTMELVTGKLSLTLTSFSASTARVVLVWPLHRAAASPKE